VKLPEREEAISNAGNTEEQVYGQYESPSGAAMG
jgi:hypothetical protein